MQPDLKMTIRRIDETNALGEELCEKLRANARANYADHSDDDIVIDDDAQCCESDEYGFWVEARVYIRAEEVGLRQDDSGNWLTIGVDDEDDEDSCHCAEGESCAACYEPLSGLEYYESIAPPPGA